MLRGHAKFSPFNTPYREYASSDPPPPPAESVRKKMAKSKHRQSQRGDPLCMKKLVSLINTAVYGQCTLKWKTIL